MIGARQHIHLPNDKASDWFFNRIALLFFNDCAASSLRGRPIVFHFLWPLSIASDSDVETNTTLGYRFSVRLVTEDLLSMGCFSSFIGPHTYFHWGRLAYQWLHHLLFKINFAAAVTYWLPGPILYTCGMVCLFTVSHSCKLSWAPATFINLCYACKV